MAKHPKMKTPSDRDLVSNPLIGGSKGVVMSGASVDEVEALEGANTFEGDVENDTNPQGGLDKPKRQARPNKHYGSEKPRHQVLQGKKTHEQQLRMLENKEDVPDARQIEAALQERAPDAAPRAPRMSARQSEFPVSRGGLNQESDHNKHNKPGQSGHKPQMPHRAEEKKHP